MTVHEAYLGDSLRKSRDDLGGRIDASLGKDYVATMQFVKYASHTAKSDPSRQIDNPTSGSSTDMYAYAGCDYVAKRFMACPAEAINRQKVIGHAPRGEYDKVGRNEEYSKTYRLIEIRCEARPPARISFGDQLATAQRVTTVPSIDCRGSKSKKAVRYPALPVCPRPRTNQTSQTLTLRSKL